MGRLQEYVIIFVVFLIFLIVGVVLLLSKGGEITQRLPERYQNQEVVDFRRLPGGRESVAAVQRLDTDSDGWQEWVVSYRYDIGAYNSPISCVIYDLEGTSPFVIYPYPLRAPNTDYLGEGRVTITVEDVLSEPLEQARPEVVVTDGRTLSIFRVSERSQAPSSAPIAFSNPYRCAGFFKANLKTERIGTEVSVWDRAGSERSQFALKRVYRPAEGSYFRSDSGTLLPPVEASIEFAYGMPQDILDTPYPEKLVLAFYKDLVGKDVKQYLSDHGLKLWAAGRLDYGSPWPKEKLQKVWVQEISYVPGPADVASAAAPSPQPQAAQVRVKVLFQGPGGEQRLREIQWHLVMQGTQWKLQDAAAF